ncbi:unnamed protein product [Effrenium voratum]|nr:unnamed protein product [Effrenium voratum]
MARDSVDERPRPHDVLEVAVRLVERMGGVAPLAMICLDPQVLEYGRELIDKKESAARISLQQVLEDILKGQGATSKLRIDAGKPFPLVRLVPDEAGKDADPAENHGSRSRSRHCSPNARRARSRSWTGSTDWSWKRGSWSSWSQGWSSDWEYGRGQGNSKGYWDWSEKRKPEAGLESKEKHEVDKTETEPPRKEVISLTQTSIAGVMVYVFGDVPIVSLSKGTEFDSNAAPLLQAALGEHSKAETLYEACDKLPEAKQLATHAKKRKIVSAVADIGFVRTRSEQVYAIAGGLQGKRSLMFALTMALCGKDRSSFRRCEDFLRSYDLHEKFRRLMKDSGIANV